MTVFLLFTTAITQFFYKIKTANNFRLLINQSIIFMLKFRLAFLKYYLIIFIFFSCNNQSNKETETENVTSEAAKAGATIGTGLGAMMLIFVWAAGSFILGLFTLFTRPK